ncbi:Rz1 family lipoprotein, partial [Escherichia coli]
STPPAPVPCVKPPAPPAWIMQPAPDWQTPLNWIISSSEND